MEWRAGASIILRKMDMSRKLQNTCVSCESLFRNKKNPDKITFSFSEKFIIKQLNVWNFAYISRIGKFDGIRTSKYRYEQSFCADYDCAAGLKKKSAFRYQKDIRSWRTIRTREPCRHHCFSMGLLVGRSWRPTRNTDFRKVSTHDLGWSARRAICRKKGRCGRHRSLSKKTNAQTVCR